MKLVYYYFVFAFRRLSRAGDDLNGWPVLRADILLLLVETRLAFSAIWLAFPQLTSFGSPLGWGLVIGAPIAIATLLLKSDDSSYLECVRRFREAPRPARVFADFAVASVSIAAVLSPLIVRTILTGKPWWT
jgi:hypothetical protein